MKLTQRQIDACQEALELLKQQVADRLFEKADAMGDGVKFDDLKFADPITVFEVSSAPTIETIRSVTTTRAARAGDVIGAHCLWHFPVSERPLLSSNSQVLCSAAATVCLLFYYLFGKHHSTLVFSDVSPIVKYAVVQDKSSGIQTGEVISDDVILKACADYNKTIINILGTPQLITLGRAAHQACERLRKDHHQLDHPSHLLQQSYLQSFIDKSRIIARLLGAAAIEPSFDLLKIVPPPDPDQVKKECLFLFSLFRSLWRGSFFFCSCILFYFIF